MQMTTKKIPYHSFSFRCTLHPDAHHLTANPHSDDLKAALPEKLSKLKAYAEHYDKTSQPIQGTLAETYLQRQGIETQTLSAVRFHDSVYHRYLHISGVLHQQDTTMLFMAEK